MDDRVSYWLDLCAYDLDTAKAMLVTKRYLYVGFMCHQVAEKSLKAYHRHSLSEEAPYTHSLKRLVDLTGLELSDEIQKLLIQLENLNIQSRYPKTKEILAQQMGQEVCARLVQETEAFLTWIQSKLSV